MPIQFLKAVLPEPASLGPLTKGKTCIGCVLKGVKDGKEKQLYIYNICSHEEAYREVGSQAICYTTGVPAMIGAMMMLDRSLEAGRASGTWRSSIPIPSWTTLNKYGLPWQVVEL